ncbi:hypothetical protein MNBD_GAMMA23-1895 [hydrothermal vent metagenome]|uniref:Uncharacterized protein n=1 Tax=hydrothermal vent metagenome TaxID=652676 RepID=A0A3B0ZNG6_9ZZZZ
MDVKKSFFIVAFISTGFFSKTILAADCKALFNKLDKQFYKIDAKDKIKKLVAVEDALFKAIDKCRSKSGMFVLMGEVQIDMGQIPLAVVYGRKAVELDNKYWRAHKLLGSARMLNHQPELGLKSLRHAVTLAPDNINTKLNLVSALLQNKAFDEALDSVNEIIAINNKDSLPTAHYLRSKVYTGNGLIIAADKDLKEALRLGFKIPEG